jgi:tetratricopeptide (TPR) repeat protein
LETIYNIQISPDALALLRVTQGLIENNQPEQALTLVSQCSTRDSAPMRNARGVCLLHMGKYEEALALFRELYFPNNAFAVPRDTPTEVRVNYVSSLLMLGNVQIAASLLYNIPDQKHPAVKRLRAAIRAWKRELPWWGKVLLPVGLYPESAPRLGRHIGRLWFPPMRQTPAPRKQAA